MINYISARLWFGYDGVTCFDASAHATSVPAVMLQGSLDGACSIYSLIMNLLIIRRIRYEDTQIYNTPKDPQTRKLFKTLFEDNGMHKYGESYYWIKKRLLEHFSDRVECVHKLKFNFDTVRESIDKQIPVIISLSSSDWAHASLCVGYEVSPMGEEKLLLLDPSSDKPKYCCWNAFVDLGNPEPNKIKYKYHYTNATGDCLVQLNDFLIITPKKMTT